MQSLDNSIKDKDFNNLYLIFGEEKYLKEEYEKKLTNSIVSESTKMMNFDILEGKATTVFKIKEISDTLPFMNDYRLIIIKNSGLLYEGRKSETEILIDYIKNIPKTTVILFIEEKVDKKLKIFKEIKKIGEVCEFSFLNEKDLADWVLSTINAQDKIMSKDDAIYLIRNVGCSMEVIYNELNKLISYKAENQITRNDIDSICTKSVESKVFQLVDSIGLKKTEQAINIYKNLIFNKTSPFMILSMIYRQFKIILQVKYLQAKSKTIQQISAELGLRDFIVRTALIQSKNFKNKVLLQAIDDCLELDNQCKTGIIQDQLGVEMLIIKYSSLK